MIKLWTIYQNLSEAAVTDNDNFWKYNLRRESFLNQISQNGWRWNCSDLCFWGKQMVLTYLMFNWIFSNLCCVRVLQKLAWSHLTNRQFTNNTWPMHDKSKVWPMWRFANAITGHSVCPFGSFCLITLNWFRLSCYDWTSVSWWTICWLNDVGPSDIEVCI